MTDFNFQALEDELRSPKCYFGLSLHQTILKLIVAGRYKNAENLKKEFKMSDKKFWWIKIEGLAEREDYTELDKFSRSKKSPIGYAPFVEVCMKHERKGEAEKYIQRVAPEERVVPYILAGDLEKAAEQAYVNKSIDELIKVLDRSSQVTSGPNSQNMKSLCSRIENLIEKLQS